VNTADTKTKGDNAMSSNAEKKSKELMSFTKKKDVEEQITRKRRKKENVMKTADARCNDPPTVSNDVNDQKPTEDHQPQNQCLMTCHWKSQSKTLT
jgi:hypothetical protein